LLILVLAEAALETVPKDLWSHPAVKRHSKRQRKPPEQLLLDRSLHHSAMRRLEDNLKRGRPDITHFALLEALGSPLNKEGLLQTYVHTNKDYAITVNPTARLPRNYNRFIGLMEQLFHQRKVPSTGETLLKLEHKTLQTLLAEAEADYILAFSRKGKPKTLQDAGKAETSSDCRQLSPRSLLKNYNPVGGRGCVRGLGDAGSMDCDFESNLRV
jgi:rRNA small subunit pseudouridine methyltransferase Nep1